jgi:hypothetical protein
MKKFLQFFIGLLVTFTLVNILYLLLLPHIDWEFIKAREALAFKNQRIKLLVFGNSTAMDAVNTQLLSDKVGSAYNFSVGGSSLQTNYTQLSEYLNQNEKPEKVLLFLNSGHWNYAEFFGVNPIVEYYYNDSLKFEGLKDIPLFRFRWLFIVNFKKLISADHRNAQIVKGQLRFNRVVPDNSSIKNEPIVCGDNNFYNSEGYEYMWRIASLCKIRNINLEVFELPCWKQAQNECPDLILHGTATNNSLDLTIHNLNNYSKCDTLLDPKKDWLSTNHLNYAGSIKITEEIIRILNR